MTNILNIGITINFDTNLYSNGLQQNVVILNNLLNESDNFRSFFIYEGKLLDSYLIDKNFCFPYVDILKNDSIEFDLIIMMGFIINGQTINKIRYKNNKTKVVLLQCGNQFIENMAFSLVDIDKSHSPIENSKEIDQIWILPHYKKNLSFMKSYFKNENVMLVPYIWDSLFIDYQIENSVYKEHKIDFYEINSKSIIIMEPNIFFSKNCILPLFIIESFERKYPTLIERCNVLCSDKLADNDYFIKLLLQMDIYQRRTNFLKLQNRTFFLNAIHQFGSILISHQQDNALNYLYLEALYLNLPLLHNSDIISNYGYYYPENDIDIAIEELYKIIKVHFKFIEEYKKNCKEIIYKFSSKNAENTYKYNELIMSSINS